MSQAELNLNLEPDEDSPLLKLGIGAETAREQKRKAESVAALALLDQEISEKLKLREQYQKDIERLHADFGLIESQWRQAEAQFKQSKMQHEQLGIEVQKQGAKLEALNKSIEHYELAVSEKKEHSQQQLARLTQGFEEDVEKINQLKRQLRETTSSDIEKEKEALVLELEQFKSETIKKSRQELERFEDDIARKKAALNEEAKSLLEETKLKVAAVKSQAEELAHAIRLSAEEQAKALQDQAQQKWLESKEELEKEATESRRKLQETELLFIQDRQQLLGRAKTLEKEARLEAQRIHTEALNKAQEEMKKAESRCEEMISETSKKAQMMAKEAERIAADILEREKTKLEIQKKTYTDSVDRARLAAQDTARTILEKAKIEAHKLMTNAAEQARIIECSAQDEGRAKMEDLEELLKQKEQERERGHREKLTQTQIEARAVLAEAQYRAQHVEDHIRVLLDAAYEEGQRIREHTEGIKAAIMREVELIQHELGGLKEDEKKTEQRLAERKKNEVVVERQRVQREQEFRRRMGQQRWLNVGLGVLVGILTAVLLLTQGSGRRPTVKPRGEQGAPAPVIR